MSVSLTLYALLVSDFPAAVGDVLQLTMLPLGPGTAVYATDIVPRRNRHDGPALADERPGGPFCCTGGVNRSGAPAPDAGVTASALCVGSVYTGPVAAALGGVDLTLRAGLVVASGVYAVPTRHLFATG
ncbi:hypothetical protein [Streptomyces sp. NRRL S-31]|uniref:hypothetical protein n=1 Tax=Streptomyces sp. NRRL S-31 TaxID=1463898 RepID=UPI00069C8E48|nr:hypothetical protein [Streptomyces sp. NRRL S-31]